MAERQYLRRQVCRSKRRLRSERRTLNDVVQGMTWSKRFLDSSVLPDGRKLLTLRNAAPSYRKPSMMPPTRKSAMEVLLLVAERNGPETLSRIAGAAGIEQKRTAVSGRCRALTASSAASVAEIRPNFPQAKMGTA